MMAGNDQPPHTTKSTAVPSGMDISPKLAPTTMADAAGPSTAVKYAAALIAVGKTDAMESPYTPDMIQYTNGVCGKIKRKHFINGRLRIEI